MNDEQARALGERAVACGLWEWRDGMLVHADGDWLRICECGDPAAAVFGDRVPMGDIGYRVRWQAAWPDLRDNATCGAVMGLLGDEAWRVGAVKSGGFCVAFDDESAPEGHRMTWVATWGEALVCVLEAL